MKKIAVVLSGCGFKDGSEITEAISTLISLSQCGVEYQVFAPRLEFEAVNHLSGETESRRDVLTEAARIARGDIADIQKLKAQDFDAVIFPGGYGAALRLCNFGQAGAGGSVLPEVKSVIQEFHSQNKPIGAICIAPALVALVLGSEGVTVTIGKDQDTAKEIEKTGATHEECEVDDFVSDREHKIVTTPAYMYGDAKPHLVFAGIQKAVKEVVEMA